MNVQLYNFQVADDSSLQLKKYGEYLFDHIIVFAPTVEEFGGTLNAEVRSKFYSTLYLVKPITNQAY